MYFRIKFRWYFGNATKTGFLRSLINIKSLKKMYQTLTINKKLLSSFPTHRILQDHLESFFGAKRSKGGSVTTPLLVNFRLPINALLLSQKSLAQAQEMYCHWTQFQLFDVVVLLTMKILMILKMNLLNSRKIQ